MAEGKLLSSENNITFLQFFPGLGSLRINLKWYLILQIISILLYFIFYYKPVFSKKRELFGRTVLTDLFWADKMLFFLKKRRGEFEIIEDQEKNVFNPSTQSSFHANNPNNTKISSKTKLSKRTQSFIYTPWIQNTYCYCKLLNQKNLKG